MSENSVNIDPFDFSIPCEIQITARIDNNEQYERKINVW